jgi:hypothetical protein
MRRRDLIPHLLDRSWSLTQLARELRCPPREVADDLEHLFRSLVHTEYAPAITPARCRKCGFTFGPEKLLKPSKCPQCHGTWIAEARIGVRLDQPSGSGAEAEKAGGRQDDPPASA